MTENQNKPEQETDEILTAAAQAEQAIEKAENTDGNEEQTADVDELTATKEELAAMKDKYLRQVAEFDNYRKRTLKEKTELILNGGEKVLEALLPVLDDLERAAQNIETSDDIATLKEGVNLIIGKLDKTLTAQGLKRMDVVGKAFDTDFHEAIALIPAQEEGQKNHVIDCVQTGYMLNEKVLRHAKVVVGQ